MKKILIMLMLFTINQLPAQHTFYFNEPIVNESFINNPPPDSINYNHFSVPEYKYAEHECDKLMLENTQLHKKNNDLRDAVKIEAGMFLILLIILISL